MNVRICSYTLLFCYVAGNCVGATVFERHGGKDGRDQQGVQEPLFRAVYGGQGVLVVMVVVVCVCVCMCVLCCLVLIAVLLYQLFH